MLATLKYNGNSLIIIMHHHVCEDLQGLSEGGLVYHGGSCNMCLLIVCLKILSSTKLVL